MQKSIYKFIFKVRLALGTTIWVSKMHRKYRNTKLKIHDFEAILPDILLNFGYGITNAEHLSKLTELSTSANICLPIIPLKEIVQKDRKFNY